MPTLDQLTGLNRVKISSVVSTSWGHFNPQVSLVCPLPGSRAQLQVPKAALCSLGGNHRESVLYYPPSENYKVFTQFSSGHPCPGKPLLPVHWGLRLCLTPAQSAGPCLLAAISSFRESRDSPELVSNKASTPEAKEPGQLTTLCIRSSHTRGSDESEGFWDGYPVISTPRPHSSWDCLSPDMFHEKGVAVMMWMGGLLMANVWHARELPLCQ